MKLKSFFIYLKLEIASLFIYPKITKNKSINYEKYWQERIGTDKLEQYENLIPNPFMKLRAEILRRKIMERNLKTISLFDYGSGDGRQLKAIEQLNLNFSNIVASDISQYSINLLSNKFNTLDIQKNPIENIKMQYSVVSAFEVLEHIPNCEEVLMQLLEISEDFLIFSVPNTGFLMHRLRLLFGRFPLQWRSTPSEHLRYWTTRDMYWWLDKVLDLESKDYDLYHYAGFPILDKIPFLKPILSKGIIVCIYKN